MPPILSQPVSLPPVCTLETTTQTSVDGCLSLVLLPSLQSNTTSNVSQPPPPDFENQLHSVSRSTSILPTAAISDAVKLRTREPLRATIRLMPMSWLIFRICFVANIAKPSLLNTSTGTKLRTHPNLCSFLPSRAALSLLQSKAGHC